MHDKPVKHKRAGTGWILHLSVLVAFIILGALGTWQLTRLQWKNSLIEQAEQRPALPVLSISDIATQMPLTMDEVEGLVYRRLEVKGRWLPDYEMRVFTSLSDARGRYEGPGVWVMTPFQLQHEANDNSGEPYPVLWINRGFVPQNKAGDYAPPPQGQQSFTGIIRPNDPANWITPSPQPKDRLLFRRDIDAMARFSGLNKPVLPFQLDLTEASLPLPQAGETKVQFSNRHLGYVLTWYGLAVVLLGVYGAYLWQRR
jgi:surfeit locus 1 family protein